MKSVKYVLFSICLMSISTALLAQSQFKSARSVDKSTGVLEYTVVRDASVSTYGLGMRIQYNPKAVRVADLSSCLSGLGEKFSNALTSCKDITEKGFIQIAVADLLRDSTIPVGAANALGKVSFSVISNSFDPGIKITNVDAAGVDAKDSDVSLLAK